MKSQVLSIYLHGFLLRRVHLLEGLELRRIYPPRADAILHQDRLVRLTSHGLALAAPVRGQLLSIHVACFEPGPFRRRRGVLDGRRGLGPMPIHVHIGVFSLHLLHRLMVLLELGHLLLGAAKSMSTTSPPIRGNGASVQASCIILQHSLLEVRRNHAVPAHIELAHLARHHRLLAHELVVLLFANAHDILFQTELDWEGEKRRKAST